jgi:hypothetical protein
MAQLGRNAFCISFCKNSIELESKFVLSENFRNVSQIFGSRSGIEVQVVRRAVVMMILRLATGEQRQSRSPRSCAHGPSEYPFFTKYSDQRSRHNLGHQCIFFLSVLPRIQIEQVNLLSESTGMFPKKFSNKRRSYGMLQVAPGVP